MSELGLTDLLDQWRRVLEGLGASVLDDVGPGLGHRDIERMEQALGFELLAELKEFLAWGVAKTNAGAYGFLPKPGFSQLLSPRQMVRQSIDQRALSWREILERPHLSMANDTEFVVLFADTGFLSMDHHGLGRTCGGIWELEEDPHWAAQNLAGLIAGCLRLAECDLLEIDDGFVQTSHEKMLRFAEELKPAALAAVPKDHPLCSDPFPTSLAQHLWFRWDVIDDPSLWTHDLEWIW